MRRTMLLMATMAFTLLLASGVAMAAVLLDQEQTGTAGGFTLSDADQRFAQTFRAGATGKLRKVSVFAGCCTRIDKNTLSPVDGGNPPGDMILKVFAVNRSGFPTGSALSTSVVPREKFPLHDRSMSWMDVTFRPAASVRDGKRYALVMTSSAAHAKPNDFQYAWGFASGDLYTRGFMSYKLGRQAWTTDQVDGWDQAFQTYVAN
jgi:hypothetical protein